MRSGEVRGSGKLVWSMALAAVALIAAPGASAAGPLARTARIGAASPATQLQLVFPLAADQAGVERLARAVSTPGSPEYGHYESIARLSARFGASPAVRARVLRYLRGVGASDVKIDATGMFADATIGAGLAQRLFTAPLARFRSALGSQYIAPTASPTVPAALRGAVTGVVGLNTQPLSTGSLAHRVGRDALAHIASQPTSATIHSGTSVGCAGGVDAGSGGDPRFDGFTPNQYLSAYGIDTLQAAGIRGAGERVALIEIDGFNGTDIQQFATCFGFALPAIQAFGVGTSKPLAPGGESTLDLEVLDAAAPGLSGIDVYETHSNAALTLRALTAPLQNRGHHPQVISASLGLCEASVYAAVGASGIRATEASLAMAAANGITFVASSGDSGSADCSSPSGAPLRRLAVNYPASSPWVTGVGGTNFQLDANNHITAQIVWNDAGLPGISPGSAGGGGLSGLFGRPDYQNGSNATTRRVVPDVSMLADIVPGYSVFCSAASDCINANNSDPWQTFGGTSAGTPLLAGGLALVDQELRLHQRVDLGLANPILYEIGRAPSLSAQVYFDVTAIGNDVGPFIGGSGAPLGCCTATVGFDDASGWGGVNLGGFVTAAEFLQPPQIGLAVSARQHPVRQKKLLVTVLCAAGCRFGAFADITIRHHKSFEVDSTVHSLLAAGAGTISLHFSKRELNELRAAVRQHNKITATVHGVAIRGKRTVAAETPGKTIRIRS
jgi:subtilase family serine protease